MCLGVCSNVYIYRFLFKINFYLFSTQTILSVLNLNLYLFLIQTDVNSFLMNKIDFHWFLTLPIFVHFCQNWFLWIKFIFIYFWFKLIVWLLTEIDFYRFSTELDMYRFFIRNPLQKWFWFIFHFYFSIFVGFCTTIFSYCYVDFQLKSIFISFLI